MELENKWELSGSTQSSPRIILIPLVNVDFTIINLSSQVSQHALNTALFLFLHVFVEATRVCNDLLQVDLCLLVGAVRLLLLRGLLERVVGLALIMDVHVGSSGLLGWGHISLEVMAGTARIGRNETVPVVAIVELFGDFITFLLKLFFVLVPLSPLPLLFLDLLDLILG